MQLNDLVFIGRHLTKAAQLSLHEGSPELSGAESTVLADLLDRRYSTVTEIAQRIGYTQGRVSTAVGALREAGLVGARQDTIDRRRTVVFATELGGVRAAELRKASAEGLLDELLAGLAPDAQASVKSALQLLMDQLRVGGLPQTRPSAGSGKPER